MDQIQEKKTTKSTFRNISKKSPLFHQCLIYKSPMTSTTKHKYEAPKLLTSMCSRPFSGHFLYCLTIGSLIKIKFRAHSTFKSRMCRGILRDVDRGPGIGLTDFHGDTNHARVTQKLSCNFKLDSYSVLWS